MARESTATTKMAATAKHMKDPACSAVDRGDNQDHGKIAAEVVKLLTPTMNELIKKAVQQGMSHFQQEITKQAQCITEVESKTAALEDEQNYLLASNDKMGKHIQALLDKVENLENRSGRSNLCIIGLPEYYTANSLLNLCERMIPPALGLKRNCTVERAHRLGPQNSDRNSPRPVLAKYQDKSSILQQFRRAGQLDIEGNSLLVFADYSQEVSRKRKAFSPICAALPNKQIRFMLLYPAILNVHAPSGEKLTFTTPADAEKFVESIPKAPRHASQNTGPPSTHKGETTPPLINGKEKRNLQQAQKNSTD